MKAQLSHKDWELISEYLDGELSAREKNRLDQRLNQQPELRNSLEEMRQTRSILRSTPRLRAPRNFTLRPEMVQKRTLPRLFPVLSFSSALATALFVLTLFLRTMSVGSTAMQAAPVMKSYEANNAVAQQAPSAAKLTPQIIQWGAQQPQAFGRGGGPGSGGGSDGEGLAPQLAAPSTLSDNATAPTEAPAAASKAAEATPETGAQLMSPALTAPGQAAPPAAPAAPPAPLAQQPATGAISQPNESNPILGVQPKDKEGQIIPQPQAEARQAVRVEPAAQPATPLSWWLIEGGLVLIALATGISAVVLWRRYRA